VNRALAGALLVWGLGSAVWAQAPNPTPQTTTRVYLITVGQGEAVWEKFGHNALWFFDDHTGIDEAYNWGMFDFKQPHFLQRFLTGDTKYWVEKYPGPWLIDVYKQYDRSVVIQRLNFSPEQARKALNFARWNAREENKYYRYDYFRDNCSTRVRDVVDLALGGVLKARTTPIGSSYTYRSESVRLVDDLKFTQLGIYTALGEPADRRLSLWEVMFIPMRMRDIVRRMRVVGPAGTPIPLVAEERTLYESKDFHERSDAPKLWIPYLVVGLLLGAEFAAVGRARERSSFVEKVFRIEVIVWAILTGILGLILLLAWTSTRHVFWFRNENLLLLNPLSLWLAVVALVSMRRPKYTRATAILAITVATLSCLALLLKALPGFTQDNIALILLLLPPQLAIAVGLRRRAPSERSHEDKPLET
jgi:hypothetical protein